MTDDVRLQTFTMLHRRCASFVPQVLGRIDGEHEAPGFCPEPNELLGSDAIEQSHHLLREPALVLGFGLDLADFLATALFLGAGFLATALFLGAGFLLTAAFLGAAFLGAAFLGAAFLGAAFLGAAFLGVKGFP